MIDVAWLLPDHKGLPSNLIWFKNERDGWCPQRLGWYTNVGFVREVALDSMKAR